MEICVMTTNTTLSVKHCPKCKYQTQIKDSRIRQARGLKMQRLLRRRVCPKCGHIFNTVEMPEKEYKDLIVVQKMLKSLCEECDDEPTK
jgi:transcriptional regulator NrdR family protein